MTEIAVVGTITLGQFLKLAGVAPTGGAAKRMLREGRVRVNGAQEMRRGRKMQVGDVVEVDGHRLVVGRG